MTTYRLTVRIHRDHLARLLHVLNSRCEILQMENLTQAGEPSPDIPDPLQRRPAPGAKKERNAEIVAKYEADPTGHNSQKLANEYGVTRERICQILRIPNVIAKAQERRRVAREAIQEEAEELTAEAQAAFNRDLDAALDLVKQGHSIRQAAAAAGRPLHSRFTGVLGATAKAQGIATQHGRHRDFGPRKARAQELANQNLNLAEIVEQMRAEGERISLNWIYTHMPHLKIRAGRR